MMLRPMRLEHFFVNTSLDPHCPSPDWHRIRAWPSGHGGLVEPAYSLPSGPLVLPGLDSSRKSIPAWQKCRLMRYPGSNIRGRFYCQWRLGGLSRLFGPDRFPRGCFDLRDTAPHWVIPFMLHRLPLAFEHEMLPHSVSKFIIK